MQKNRLTRLVALALVVSLVVVSSAAAAKSLNAKGGAPTAPTNLKVTATSPYSVSLSWGPSNDNSGVWSYVIQASNGKSASVPQAFTTYTFTAGLWQLGTYSFTMYAVDGTGLRSSNSNTVTATLPADTTLPTKPVLTVTEIGPTHISLSWPSTDDAPRLYYTVYLDGNVYYFGTNTAGDVARLLPETTYTITVQARINTAQLSPMSDKLTVTTAASDPNDVTAPTTPGNLRTNGMVFDNEIWLFWDESTDNVDPQQFIRYDVFDNGVLVESTAGSDRTIFYGERGVLNTITIVAIDAAGNESPPATIVIDLTSV